MKNPQYLTGAQALVATLRAHHIDTIFGIPGVHTLSLYDAFYDEPGLHHILARHEQGAGFMAEGYARVTGRPGVACVITGPGATNITTPVASAYADSVPLLVISSSLASAGRGELHEIKDQFGMMEALTGWAQAVERAEDIPCVLYEAFRALALRQGRPRGAYVQIPFPLLEERVVVEIPSPAPVTPKRPDPHAIQQAVTLLQRARRPMIIAGAGVTMAGANTQLVHLAERLQAPVILGAKSHDVLPTSHPLVLTTNDSLPTAMDTFIASADLVLVVGSKLGYSRTADGRLRLPSDVIHIDIDESEIGRDYATTVGVVADACLALEALLAELPEVQQERGELMVEVEQMRETLAQHTRTMHYQGFPFLEQLRASLPPETIVVADMTLLGYACAQWLPVYEPRTFLHPIELCTIGGGLPLAIGAKVARPERPVVALCGDGGFLLNAGELATLAQEHLPIVIVIFNDAAFATVKLEQRRRFHSRYIATDPVTPDYLALAQAFHIRAERITTPDAFGEALQQALSRNEPTMIDVVLPPRVW